MTPSAAIEVQAALLLEVATELQEVETATVTAPVSMLQTAAVVGSKTRHAIYRPTGQAKQYD